MQLSFSIQWNYVPHQRVEEHTVCGADPVGVGVNVSFGIGVCVSMTLPCLHDILLTCGWILTKFAWM